jgi:site-specific DNA-cytosine methylase
VVEEPMPFDPTQITHPENRSRPQPGDPAPTLAHRGHPPAIAYVAPVAGALQSGGHKTPGSATGQDAETGLLVAYSPAIAGSLTAAMGRMNGQPQDEAADKFLIVQAPEVSGPLVSTTHQAGARSTDIESGALVIEAQAFSMRGRDGENVIEPEADDVAPSMTSGGGGSNKPFVAYAFQERRRPDAAGENKPTAEWLEDQSYALTAPDGGGRAQERLVAFAFKPSHYTRDKDGAPSELVPALSADADKGDQDPLILQEEVKAFTVSGQANGFAWESDVNPAILAHPQSDTSQLQYGVRIGTAVRRLTPRECERLQGFEDDFTLIPYSDAHRDEADVAQTIAYLLDAGYSDNEARALASTPDGPRYRALGNSQAVAVIDELGARIEWLLAGEP